MLNAGGRIVNNWIYPGHGNTEWTIYIRNAMATILMEGKKMTAFLRLRNI